MQRRGERVNIVCFVSLWEGKKEGTEKMEETVYEV